MISIVREPLYDTSMNANVYKCQYLPLVILHESVACGLVRASLWAPESA